MSPLETGPMTAGVPHALFELWFMAIFGAILILLRVFVRTRIVGIRAYDADDYLVWFVLACSALTTACSYIVSRTGDTSGLGGAARAAMPAAEAAARQRGSRWSMAGWLAYVLMMWALKVNMLFLYRRVAGAASSVRRCLPHAAVFVGLAGSAALLLLATACRPFPQLWQITPDPGPTCYPQAPVYLITILVLNILTDVLIIVLPIPIIWALKMPTRRKLGLTLLFCSGICVIAAAVLRVYYVLVLKHVDSKASIWSGRESFLAIIAGQAAILGPLFRPRFWGRETWWCPGRSRKRRGAALSSASTAMVVAPGLGRKPSRLSGWWSKGPLDKTWVTWTTRTTGSEAWDMPRRDCRELV